MKITDFILDLLYPRKCVFCGRLMGEEPGRTCSDCRRNLPFVPDGDAKSHGDYYKVCVSCFYYEDKVRDSILNFKFGGRSGYGTEYAKYLAECIENNLKDEFDVITWVPVSKKRYRKRGYDQAKILAEATADILGMKAVRLLDKPVHNKAQSTIDSAEKRRANVMSMYKAVNTDMIKGKRILVIDDIKTTGATLSECSRILLLSEAEEVLCAALAKTRHVDI